jgi:two-component system chemotaxis response regulator CheB
LADEVLRVLIVEDSALYRQLVRNVMREVAGVDVVGAANSGKEALEQLDQLDPDLLTLDVRMPDVDGIAVLKELKRRRSRTKAIMLSGLTAAGAQVTTDALLEGAFDFILKPTGPDAEGNRRALLEALQEKIQAFRDSQAGRAALRRTGAPAKRGEVISRSPQPAAVGQQAEPTEAEPAFRPRHKCDVIVIATSTGGPVALREVLPQLPGDLPVPLLIIQHMPPQYTHSLAQRLNEASQLEVVEACDGMVLEPGWAFVAPGGRHMKVESVGSRRMIRITDDPPERSCRPSADYLFRSVAEAFGGNVVAVVMTGMGRDGTEGCRDLKKRGAFVITQQADSCTVYGMPKAVVEEQLADRQVPLDSIAGVLTNLVRLKRDREQRHD